MISPVPALSIVPSSVPSIAGWLLRKTTGVLISSLTVPMFMVFEALLSCRLVITQFLFRKAPYSLVTAF